MPPPAIRRTLRPSCSPSLTQRALLTIAVGAMNINELMNIDDVRDFATIFPRPCKFNLESGVRVPCDVRYLCANFGLPRPLCSRVIPDVRDRQTDVRQTSDVRQHHRLMPGRGHNKKPRKATARAASHKLFGSVNLKTWENIRASVGGGGYFVNPLDITHYRGSQSAVSCVSVSVSVSIRDETAWNFAVAALQFYRRSTNVSAEMEEMDAEGKKKKPLSSDRDGAAADAAADAADSKDENANEDQRRYTVMQLFKDPELRQPLFIACALVTIQQFSGINAVRRCLR